MNCKPGDLAVIVRATTAPEWAGKIVRVLHIYPDKANDAWVTDPLPSGFAAVYDSSLRPIRDNPGEDETLTWAGKPQTVEA